MLGGISSSVPSLGKGVSRTVRGKNLLYELIFLVRQDTSESQVTALADHFKSQIEAGAACVSKVEYCGLKSLAYRIKKNRKAHYVLFNIEGPSQALDEVERQMRFHEDILRYLRVSVESLDPDPSPLVQSRSYREPGEGYRENRGREEAVVAEAG